MFSGEGCLLTSTTLVINTFTVGNEKACEIIRYLPSYPNIRED